jgi:chromosome partitioning protein
MDRQATISHWAVHRVATTPEVAQIEAPQLEPVIERLRSSAYDYVFIDTPGIDSPGTLAAIRVSDLCIVPCRPTPAEPTLAAIHRLGKPFAFVLNQTPSRSYRVRDAADGLRVLGILPEVNIVLRTDYQDALGLGLGGTEHNPKGAAAAEIRQLWGWMAKRIEAGTDKSKQALTRGEAA